LIFLDHFNVLILKNKKYYFDIFINEKHFENLPELHFQIETEYFFKKNIESYFFLKKHFFSLTLKHGVLAGGKSRNKY